MDEPTWNNLISVRSQMDPKLRPSFADIVKTLEEILNRLRNEDSERDRKFLNLDNNERKPKGKCLHLPKDCCRLIAKECSILYFEDYDFRCVALCTCCELFYPKSGNDSGTVVHTVHWGVSFGKEQLFLKIHQKAVPTSSWRETGSFGNVSCWKYIKIHKFCFIPATLRAYIRSFFDIHVMLGS